jgi:hypothetical protein
MSDPNKVDPTNSQKLFKATSNANRVRCWGAIGAEAEEKRRRAKRIHHRKQPGND